MKTHGQSGTKLYAIWVTMRQRCYNTNNKDFYNYGAKGIKVCDEWLKDFSEFYRWSMENGYAESLSIDRIDPYGNYEPSNCRWATIQEQANNKKNTIYVEVDGSTYTLTELSNLYGIRRETIEMRYLRGDRGDRLVRPVRYRTA
ncbi:MAG: hypothetical protein E6342_15765 [Clostridium sp.]|uniref:hypothetical protein n=1 Tax=Clostridium TaxID=1485 RepID=UPI0028FFAE43|nr:hypothetical protein [Clostridium sp.]MDU1278356.1 hypothetical protein [Clostridium sp.]MDU7089162.1 hypothetical protein [Clostridium sp.]MDU7948759.1 hypothetical protein [Clostridium sp.]